MVGTGPSSVTLDTGDGTGFMAKAGTGMCCVAGVGS